jgi:hypothetical protein
LSQHGKHGWMMRSLLKEQRAWQTPFIG